MNARQVPGRVTLATLVPIVLALSGGLAFAGTTDAEETAAIHPETTTTIQAAVLFIPSEDIADDLADDLTEVMAASLERDGRAHVMPKERFRLLLDRASSHGARACAMDAGCVRRVGSDAEFDFVVIVNAKRRPSGYRLQLVRYSMAVDLVRVMEIDIDDKMAQVAEALDSARDELLRPDGALLTVMCTASGASVRIDGVFIGKTPMKPREILPGDHVLLVEREGYLPVKQHLHCEAAWPCGADIKLQRELPEPTVPAVVQAAEPEAKPEPSPKPAQAFAAPPQPPAENMSIQRVFAWTTLSLAGASTITGTIFAVRAKKLQDELAGSCDGGSGRCDLTRAAAADKKDDGELSALLTNVFFGVAGAAAVTSLVLFLTEPDAERTVEIMPTVGAGQFGVGATLRF